MWPHGFWDAWVWKPFSSFQINGCKAEYTQCEWAVTSGFNSLQACCWDLSAIHRHSIYHCLPFQARCEPINILLECHQMTFNNYTTISWYTRIHEMSFYHSNYPNFIYSMLFSNTLTEPNYNDQLLHTFDHKSKINLIVEHYELDPSNSPAILLLCRCIYF